MSDVKAEADARWLVDFLLTVFGDNFGIVDGSSQAFGNQSSESLAFSILYGNEMHLRFPEGSSYASDLRVRVQKVAQTLDEIANEGAVWLHDTTPGEVLFMLGSSYLPEAFGQGAVTHRGPAYMGYAAIKNLSDEIWAEFENLKTKLATISDLVASLAARTVQPIADKIGLTGDPVVKRLTDNLSLFPGGSAPKLVIDHLEECLQTIGGDTVNVLSGLAAEKEGNTFTVREMVDGSLYHDSAGQLRSALLTLMAARYRRLLE